MKNENGSVSEAPGAEVVVTIDMVREFVRRDLERCISMLDAIYKDVPTCIALADYLHGRYQNSVHAKELARQRELDLK